MQRIAAALVLLALFSADQAAACGREERGYRKSRAARVWVPAARSEPERDAGVRGVAASAVASADQAPIKTSKPADPPGCKRYSATLGAMITIPCSK